MIILFLLLLGFGVQKYKKSLLITKYLRKNYLFSNYFSNFASDFEKKQIK